MAYKSQAESSSFPPTKGRKVSEMSTWALAFHEKTTLPVAMSTLTKSVSEVRKLLQRIAYS